jgi:hypothetical protein
VRYNNRPFHAEAGNVSPQFDLATRIMKVRLDVDTRGMRRFVGSQFH